MVMDATDSQGETNSTEPPIDRALCRDATTGKFLKGWKGGPGNRTAHYQTKNRMAILRAVTPEVAFRLTMNLVNIADDDKAKPADRVKATELLLRYAAGEPTQKHDIKVTPAAQSAPLVDLDAEDTAALERIRAKLLQQGAAAQSLPAGDVIDAEVISHDDPDDE